MAVFRAGAAYPLNMNTFDPNVLLEGVVTYDTSTRYIVEFSSTGYDDFRGSFTYDAFGDLADGLLTAVYEVDAGNLIFSITGLSVDVSTYLNYADAGDRAGANAYFFRGNDTITGSNGNDILRAYAGNDILDGGLGNDRLYGGTGNDRYYVNSASDVVYEVVGEGLDSVTASVSHRLSAGQSVEYLYAATGTAAINLTGNEFGSRIYGNNGANVIDGVGGNDIISGYAGNDYLKGNTGDDIVYGMDGNDLLTGAAGNDDLFGGAGADDLIGGTGLDYLQGDAGADYFVFTTLSDSTFAAAGRDHIVDFKFAEHDKIDLSDLDARTNVAGDQGFSFIGSAQDSNPPVSGQLRSYISGGHTFVVGDVNGDRASDFAIELDTAVTLVSTDFIL